MICDDFCKILKKGRKEYAMTQREAGAIALINQKHYSEYETGAHIPSLLRAQELLNAVGYELRIEKVRV